MRALLGGIAAVGAVVVLVRLSLWQWSRAGAEGSLQSYTYAVEWMLLAVLLVVGPLLLRRRSGRPPAEHHAERDVSGHVIGPPLRPGEELGEVTGVRLRRWLSRRR
jgi:cytochrome oxidase assembly protein ShyY1